jgi:hypothetical protein
MNNLDEDETHALRALVEKLKAENLICKHPGCCCVCGHQGTCPEDGPSHVEGIED